MQKSSKLLVVVYGFQGPKPHLSFFFLSWSLFLQQLLLIYRFFRVRNGATHFFTKQETAAFFDMVYFDNAIAQR